MEERLADQVRTLERLKRILMPKNRWRHPVDPPTVEQFEADTATRRYSAVTSAREKVHTRTVEREVFIGPKREVWMSVGTD